jgi:Dyp-type peroxidase family
VHILLMLYATDEAKLAVFYEACFAGVNGTEVEQIRKLDTHTLRDEQGGFREHFGFRDAIGQPIIEGLSKVGSPDNTVKAGEFILGYPNEYSLLTETPTVGPEHDPQQQLPDGPDGSRDLGCNGSYVVFRQLAQNVQEFWQFIDQATQQGGTSDPEARLKLAAKMVGRWPSGTPLVESPDQDNPALADKNEFAYHQADPHGFKCPFGAHLRRSNPRDSLEPGPGTDRSIAVNKTHRLLRRGRTYGQPVTASLNPQDILAANPSGERGLHFVCISANISRQFEFIQQTWMNNPKFNGLYRETDPLTGDRHPGDLGAADQFTIQAEPVRTRVNGLPQFVTVQGGAYFFLPSIGAFRYLTQQQL